MGVGSLVAELGVDVEGSEDFPATEVGEMLAGVEEDWTHATSATANAPIMAAMKSLNMAVVVFSVNISTPMLLVPTVPIVNAL